MLQCVHNLEQVLDKGIPERLLRDEQIEALKHKKNKRWHPYLGDPLFLTWNDVLHFVHLCRGMASPEREQQYSLETV